MGWKQGMAAEIAAAARGEEPVQRVLMDDALAEEEAKVPECDENETFEISRGEYAHLVGLELILERLIKQYDAARHTGDLTSEEFEKGREKIEQVRMARNRRVKR